MTINYVTHGTCSKMINIEVDDGVIQDVQFIGGCNGNAKGISKLIVGMSVEDVIDKLEGTTCGMRDTSCPDQLAQALKEIL